MKVHELIAALRIFDPETEIVLGKRRPVLSRRRGITAAAIGRPDVVYRIDDRFVVELGEVAPSEAASAVPVICLWPVEARYDQG